MPNTLTDSAEVVGNTIYELLLAQKGNFSPDPVIDVFYGDQSLIPNTPAICVMPGPSTKDFQGASMRTLNVFETLVYVYFAKIQDVQQNLHGCMMLADAVDIMVQTNNGSDNKLGGIVTSTICIQKEPGITTKGGPVNASLMMAARMTFRSQSKTLMFP